MRTCKFLTACVVVGAAAALAPAQGGEKLPILETFQGTVANDKKPELKTGFIAAEADCCSFLELSLRERGGELALSIAAPPDGQPIANELAAAFASHA